MEFGAEYLKLQADGAGSIDRNNVWSRLSVERAKHFIGKLQKYTTIYEDDTFADFGGGNGAAALAMAKATFCPVTVVDLTQKKLEVSKGEGLVLVNAPLEELPFADESISWGFCSHTIEHVTSLEVALKEIYRVVKYGCCFIIPLEDDEQAKKSTPHMHHSPDPEWWAARIREQGFAVKLWQDWLNDCTDIYALAIKDDFAEEFNAQLQRDDSDLPESAGERVQAALALLGGKVEGSWADVGGGNGVAATQLLAAGAASVTVFDINSSKRGWAEDAGASFAPAKIEALPIDDASYDYIYSSHTLEHTPYLEKAIAELHRAAKKGGCIIVPLHGPAVARDLMTHWSWSDDVEWWLAKYRQAGFGIVEWKKATQASKVVTVNGSPSEFWHLIAVVSKQESR